MSTPIFKKCISCYILFCSAVMNSDCSIWTQMFVKVHIWVCKIPKSLVKPDKCTVNTFAPQHFEAQYRRRIFYYGTSSCNRHTL